MLAGMKFGGSELVSLIVAVSFAAGLNVYATVATLGLRRMNASLHPPWPLCAVRMGITPPSGMAVEEKGVRRFFSLLAYR